MQKKTTQLQFVIPGMPELWLPCTYCGEWVGWDEMTIIRERDGILTIHAPTDSSIKLHFRRDDLERDGHAYSVTKDGRKSRGGIEAFVPDRWQPRLNASGGVEHYERLPEPGTTEKPSGPLAGYDFKVSDLARLAMHDWPGGADACIEAARQAIPARCEKTLREGGATSFRFECGSGESVAVKLTNTTDEQEISVLAARELDFVMLETIRAMLARPHVSQPLFCELITDAPPWAETQARLKAAASSIYSSLNPDLA